MNIDFYTDVLNTVNEDENGEVLISLSESMESTINIKMGYPLFKQFVEEAETLLKAMMIAREEK